MAMYGMHYEVKLPGFFGDDIEARHETTDTRTDATMEITPEDRRV